MFNDAQSLILLSKVAVGLILLMEFAELTFNEPNIHWNIPSFYSSKLRHFNKSKDNQSIYLSMTK